MVAEARLAASFVALGTVIDRSPDEARLRLRAIVNVDGTLSPLVAEVSSVFVPLLLCICGPFCQRDGATHVRHKGHAATAEISQNNSKLTTARDPCFHRDTFNAAPLPSPP